MKQFKISLLLVFAVAAMVLSGCKPEEIVLGDPPSKLEGINDSFVLVSVTQVDENARPGTTETMDVSAAFIGSDAPSITFDSQAFSFTYDPGTAPNYLGTSGTWAFDDNDYPTKITMDNGTQYDLKLLHTIRPQDQYLEVELSRACGGGASVSYRYKFQRN